MPTSTDSPQFQYRFTAFFISAAKLLLFYETTKHLSLDFFLTNINNLLCFQKEMTIFATDLWQDCQKSVM